MKHQLYLGYKSYNYKNTDIPESGQGIASNLNRKNAGKAILISIKIKVKAKSVHENGHFMWMKGKVHNKVVLDMNLCLLIKYQDT